MNPRLGLRLARGAEGVSGILAAVYTSAQPWPSADAPAASTVTGAGAAALTFWLAWRLGSPTRPVVAVARLICAATVLRAFGGIFLVADTFAPSTVGDLVPTLWFLSQVVVGVGLWHARDYLPGGRRSNSDVAAA
jgi:hypothetical protein